MIARSIDRFSIVKLQGKIYVLENMPKKPILITEDSDGKRIGKEIDELTELEVVFYPAQLAFHYLKENK